MYICRRKILAINDWYNMKKIIFIIFAVVLIGCEIDPDATYSVLYYGNGETSGFPPVDRNSYLSGETAVVKGTGSLLKTGHQFVSWNTKQDGSGDTYSSGVVIPIKNINVFLYAVWAKEE